MRGRRGVAHAREARPRLDQEELSHRGADLALGARQGRGAEHEHGGERGDPGDASKPRVHFTTANLPTEDFTPGASTWKM